jgi:predicted amidophosphoribosyltransferase
MPIDDGSLQDSAKTCPRCGGHVSWNRAICPLCRAPLQRIEQPRTALRTRLWGLVAIGGLVLAAVWTYRPHR